MSSISYDRQTSFAQFSSANPTAQQPGVSLDVEFNSVKVALDDTQQNLARIQDDDGVLKRGSVGRAQFDSSITLGFAAPAQWAPNTVYDANVSTVFSESKFYIANATHTSGATFDAAKWDEIADFTLAAVIPDGSITSAKLANNAVTSSAIADGSISNTKIATGAIDNNKIANGAVDLSKLAPGIGPSIANIVLPAGMGPLPWPLPDLPAEGGWDWADGGVLLSNTPFPALRAVLIAANFPHGQDGSGNPKKPDTRGRVIAGVDDFGSGAASRLTSASLGVAATLGVTGGQETVTLTASQIPTITSSGSISGSAIPGGLGQFVLGNGSIGTQTTQNTGGNNVAGSSGVFAGSSSASVTGSASVTSNNTGGGAHTNIAPILVCKMIIKAH
jgi:microcystin-dependent protein